MLLGSFASLVAYRLPRGETLATGRSRCPQCGHTLGIADLVPVFSYLWSRGKCRHCQAAISARYPLIEIITALLFVLALAVAGPGLQAFALGLLAVGLVIMTAIDLEHQIIPDQAFRWRWRDWALPIMRLPAIIAWMRGYWRALARWRDFQSPGCCALCFSASKGARRWALGM